MNEREIGQGHWRDNTVGSTAGDAISQRFTHYLSAAIDGEAPLAGLSGNGGGGRAGARLSAQWSDAEKREWDLYHLVGDALRSSDLADAHRGGWDFSTRFAERFAAEPVHVAPQAEDAVNGSRGASTASFGGRVANGSSGWAARFGKNAGMLTGTTGLAGWFGGRGRMPAAAAAAAAVVTLAWALVPAWHGTGAGNALGGSSGTVTVASAGNWQRVNLNTDRDLDPYLAAHQEFASDRGSLGYMAYAGAGH